MSFDRMMDDERWKKNRYFSNPNGVDRVNQFTSDVDNNQWESNSDRLMHHLKPYGDIPKSTLSCWTNSGGRLFVGSLRDRPLRGGRDPVTSRSLVTPANSARACAARGSQFSKNCGIFVHNNERVNLSIGAK